MGRVTFNLAEVLNSSLWSAPKKCRLEYCSANDGYLLFSINSIHNTQKTELRLGEIDSKDLQEFVGSGRHNNVDSKKLENQNIQKYRNS